MDSIIGEFLHLGNDLRALRAFIQKRSVSQGERIRQALSASVDIAMFALESSIDASRAGATSLLQLQETIRKPRILANCLRILTEHCQKDSEDIALLVRACDSLSEEHPWLRRLLQEVIARGVWCQLEAMGQSVGLDTTSMSSRMMLNNRPLNNDSIRNLLASEVTEILVESQQGLTLLKSSSPKHPLLSYSSSCRIKPQWEHSWERISKLQTQAIEYETSFKQAILDLQPSRDPSVESHHQLTASTGAQPTYSTIPDVTCMDLEGPAAMETVLGSEVSAFRDSVYQATTSAISSTDFSTFDLQPDLRQSMSLSLMPLLKSQHRLLSYSILSLLLETHQLQAHLTTQSRFQLMGDGLFASRLSHALFDSSEASGEGRRRKGSRTGLRLQSRDTWPPASSELRLVLMGILSESMLTDDGQRFKSKSTVCAPGPLLESLSFAMRDLSDEDLEKCRDADTIHALDFLALQYRPPTLLLEAVITSRSLKVYDDIFQHLLRLLRVKSAAQELVRDVSCRLNSRSNTIPKDHRIRLEVHNFVSTITDWVQNAVIMPKWGSFAATIDRVRRCLEKMDYEGALEAGRGLQYIRSLHEDVVDDIARTLFLKRKYMEVRAVLDNSFDTVLQLAKHIRMGQNSQGVNDDDATIRRLHESFRKQVKTFLTYLRANSSRTQDERDYRGPEALMEQLALRLDMFGYYEKKA